MYLNGQQSLILQAVEFTGYGSFNGYGSDLPASHRSSNIPAYSFYSIGFRPALYVKL